MKRIITNYPLASFIVVSFIYSWTLWLLMILSKQGMLPFNFPTNFLGSFGPAIGAIVVSLIISGRKGLKELFGRLKIMKVSALSYSVALLFIVIVTVIALAIFYFAIDSSVSFGKIDSWLNAVIYFFVIFFLGGPLGEEIGWRGFLQPKLMERFSPIVASLIIFAIWFAWHIPLFWLEGAAQQGSSMLNFATMVLCMSFLFTWLYLKTKGSLMLALLFHTSINYVSAYITPIVLPFTEQSKAFGQIFSITIIALTILIVLIERKEFLKNPTCLTK
jgi:hypothetical protein